MLGGLQTAITTKDLPVQSDRIWELLADGSRYADWVVGASHVRDVEAAWPAVGSKFHHTVGVWPFHLRDETVVEVCELGRRLVLEARARPFGRVRVEIVLEDIPTGTRVVMYEEAQSPAAARWGNPVLTPLIHVRNVEALRRLAALCDGSGDPLAPRGDDGSAPSSSGDYGRISPG
jgi:hypothetical protein